MAWLDGVDNPGGPGECPAPLSVRAWNWMDGLDWQAIEMVAELLGVRDLEALVADLVVIRDWRKNRDAH